MLILSRKAGESIIIAGRITVRIMRIEGDVVKVGIDAPTDIPVHRQEVYDEIQKSNREALSDGHSIPPHLSPGPPDRPPSKSSGNGAHSSQY